MTRTKLTRVRAVFRFIGYKIQRRRELFISSVLNYFTLNRNFLFYWISIIHFYWFWCFKCNYQRLMNILFLIYFTKFTLSKTIYTTLFWEKREKTSLNFACTWHRFQVHRRFQFNSCCALIWEHLCIQIR